MQSPAPQPTSRQASQASPVRRSRIRIKPILGGIAFIVIGAKNLGPTLEQGYRWETLQREGQRTAAQLLTSQVAITSSGKIASYEVSYEFTAAMPDNAQLQQAESPLAHNSTQGEAGAVASAPVEPNRIAESPVTEPSLTDDPPTKSTAASGSTTSAAEIQAMLQDQFWNPTPDGHFRSPGASPGEGQDDSQTSEPALPPGQRYIRGRQTMSKDDYQKLGFGLGSEPLNVIYDAQDPSNSAIAGTGSYPTGKLAFLLLLILGGSGLLALGLSPFLTQPS